MDESVKSTETRKGWKYEKTILLQKSCGKKDWKSTVHVLHSQATEVE